MPNKASLSVVPSQETRAVRISLPAYTALKDYAGKMGTSLQRALNEAVDDFTQTTAKARLQALGLYQIDTKGTRAARRRR